MDTRDFYYWRTHTGAELDLLVLKDGKRIGFEVKYAEVPKITKSMHIVIEDLKLDNLYIINKGSRRFWLSTQVHSVPADQIENYDFLP